MVLKTKKNLMICITLASVSIVLFIVMGIYTSVYISNMNLDKRALNDIIAYNDVLPELKEPINKEHNIFGFANKPNSMDSIRRSYFYFIVEDNVITHFYVNMPMMLDSINTTNDIYTFIENLGISDKDFKDEILAKDSGTIKCENMYLLFQSRETNIGTMYTFLDTTMTHMFFSNIIKMGVLVVILSIFYISFISKKILDRALDPLEMSIENQKRFTGDASHELRTPLTAMRSNLDILISYDLDKKEQDVWLNNISSEIDRMTKLTQDLLTLSRNEIIEKEKSNFYIDDVLDRVNFNYNNICNIKISGGGFDVYGVSEELYQLIVIFVDNAIKYNDKEEKIISIIAEIDKNKKYFNLIIEDNGNGIDVDKFDNIFERFYREDKARTSTQNGFGLGLSIAKNIIDDYKGKVKIKSTIGEGTKFKIMLSNVKNYR